MTDADMPTLIYKISSVHLRRRESKLAAIAFKGCAYLLENIRNMKVFVLKKHFLFCGALVQ